VVGVCRASAHRPQARRLRWPAASGSIALCSTATEGDTTVGIQPKRGSYPHEATAQRHLRTIEISSETLTIAVGFFTEYGKWL
jgi:hypothetical protein